MHKIIQDFAPCNSHAAQHPGPGPIHWTTRTWPQRIHAWQHNVAHLLKCASTWPRSSGTAGRWGKLQALSLHTPVVQYTYSRNHTPKGCSGCDSRPYMFREGLQNGTTMNSLRLVLDHGRGFRALGTLHVSLFDGKNVLELPNTPGLHLHFSLCT